MADATGSEATRFVRRPHRFGPMPKCNEPRERRRKIKIAWMYVVDGWPSSVVAAVHHIHRDTVIAYVHDVLRYPEPEAETIRATIRAAQAGRPEKPSCKVGG